MLCKLLHYIQYFMYHRPLILLYSDNKGILFPHFLFSFLTSLLLLYSLLLASISFSSIYFIPCYSYHFILNHSLFYSILTKSLQSCSYPLTSVLLFSSHFLFSGYGEWTYLCNVVIGKGTCLKKVHSISFSKLQLGNKHIYVCTVTLLF